VFASWATEPTAFSQLHTWLLVGFTFFFHFLHSNKQKMLLSFIKWYISFFAMQTLQMPVALGQHSTDCWPLFFAACVATKQKLDLSSIKKTWSILAWPMWTLKCQHHKCPGWLHLWLVVDFTFSFNCLHSNKCKKLATLIYEKEVAFFATSPAMPVTLGQLHTWLVHFFFHCLHSNEHKKLQLSSTKLRCCSLCIAIHIKSIQ